MQNPDGGKAKCPKGCKPDKPAPLNQPGGKTDESGGDGPADVVKPTPNPAPTPNPPAPTPNPPAPTPNPPAP